MDIPAGEAAAGTAILLLIIREMWSFIKSRNGKGKVDINMPDEQRIFNQNVSNFMKTAEKDTDRLASSMDKLTDVLGEVHLELVRMRAEAK